MNLYIGNLSLDVGENDLRCAFEQLGQVREVHLVTDKSNGESKGYGFVEMPSKNDAEQAINEMNGKEFMGRTIIVNPAKPKTNRRVGSRSRDLTSRGRGRRY